MPATKRRRRHGQANSATTPARVSLPNLPIEILAEILFYTDSPPTVLAVSRTCSFLYRSLAHNPDASFIWRTARKAYKPIPLPDPGDNWKQGEAAYAAFVFGGGVCEVCGKRTREMYVSFAARIRLCGGWHCRTEYLGERLVNVTTELQGVDRQLLWVPPLESTRCFYASRVGALVWPRGEVLLRKSDWETVRVELQAFKEASQAQGEGKGEGQARLVERCRAALKKLPHTMEVCERLIRWKWERDRIHREMKNRNETWTKNLAFSEGWDLKNLVATQTYGSLQRYKNFVMEAIEMEDVTPIRPAIESELLALQARHGRQDAEETYRKNLTAIKKMYERMRCGTLDAAKTQPPSSSEPFALPLLPIFCTLQSVRALKGSPDPSAIPPGSSSVPSDIDSPLAVSLIKTDIHAWLVPVQKHLMTLLGYPNGWQSASTRTVHPLKRVTARFFCRRCGQGNVSRGYRRELCLDFKGVCLHVCKGTGGKTPDWKVDVFEKDNKAISIVKRLLDLKGLSEDNSVSEGTLKGLGGVIRCMTCPGWTVMDFETAIGHAHRHESMDVCLLPTSAPVLGAIHKQIASPGSKDEYQIVSKTRLAFERGNAELLLEPSYRAKTLCKKINYGCKHCFRPPKEGVPAVLGVEKPGEKGLRAMSFHGLRSHVKKRHGIQEVGDEDFFCYTRIT